MGGMIFYNIVQHGVRVTIVESKEFHVRHGRKVILSYPCGERGINETQDNENYGIIDRKQ